MLRPLFRALLFAAGGPAIVLAGGCTGGSHESATATSSDGGADGGCTSSPTFLYRTMILCDVVSLSIPCGFPVTPDSGVTNLPMTSCETYCTSYIDGADGGLQYCDIDTDVNTIQCYLGCGAAVGRRPDGLAARRSKRRRKHHHALGRHFADAAFLEAASVHAFLVLREELRAHGAPANLIRRATRAARDEVRHARAMSDLARRYGGELVDPIVRRRGVRPLADVALENARTGCVDETYGALVAWWQATHATDPEIARVMRRIALDETTHAELAWSVHHWALSRLDRGARSMLRAAMSDAADRLETQAKPDAELVDRAGLPYPPESLSLLVGLRRILWS